MCQREEPLSGINLYIDDDADILKDKLGIELVKISWNDAGNYLDHKAGEDFLERFSASRQFNIEDVGMVNSLLKQGNHHLVLPGDWME